MAWRPAKDRTRQDPLTHPTVLEEFQAFLESAPDAIVIVDPQGTITTVNRQTERLFGYSRQELLGRTVEMLMPGSFRAAHIAQRAEYARNPRVRPMGSVPELRGVRKDGTEFPVEISLSPVEGPSGLYVFSTIRDVTLQNRTEQELRQAKSELEARVQERTTALARATQELEIELEQHRQAGIELAQERDRARLYLDVAEVALLGLEPSGHIMLINRKGLRMLGYEETELIGQDWFATCMPRQRREGARRLFGQVVNGMRLDYIEMPVVTKHGEERLVAWHNTLLRDGAGKVLGTLSSGEDITEQRRSQEAVKRLAAIVASSDDAILSMTLDGTIASWNAAAERLYGYSASEAIGQPVGLLMPPESARSVPQMIEKLKRGEHIHGLQTVHVTRDGRSVNISMTAFPILGDHGRTIACATVSRDITERLKLEQLLRQSHKMEAIGRLAGGVAHDFNNLLGVILGDSQLLLSNAGTPASCRKRIQEIKETADEAAALTRQLLAFSRQQVLQTSVLDLHAVLAGFENMLRRLAGEGIALELAMSPDLGAVRADPNQLLQVILNLVVNARDAMPRGGHVVIETANVTLDSGYAASNPGVSPGPYVQISVTDNGPGMDRETMAHIFEPFFTTKDGGQGAGMGLATAYGIVEQLGGSIWVHSEVGKGATFKIFLPRVDGVAAKVRQPRMQEELPRGRETVLLVEDADLLRRVTREFLERMGYTVLAAESAEEALAIAQQHTRGIDLLLTDLAMPGMNGQELAQQLVGARPGLKVLYTSGYGHPILAEQGAHLSDVPFIEKPFTWENLARKVRRTLDKPNQPAQFDQPSQPGQMDQD